MCSECLEGIGPGDGVLEEGSGLVLELPWHIPTDLRSSCGWGEVIVERSESLGEFESGEVHIGSARELDTNLGLDYSSRFEGLLGEIEVNVNLLGRGMMGRCKEYYDSNGGGAIPRRPDCQTRERSIGKGLDGDITPGRDNEECDG